jgi:predicted dehydrogenase
MIKAAREKRVLLTVFHCRRLDGDYLTIKKIIDDGLIGEPFHCEAFLGEYKHPGDWWRSHKAISGGGIYDWGAHFTDWILNLMPYKMQSVTGFMSKRVWHDVTNEDHCRAIIRFEGDRSAELEISSIAAVGKPKWRILGTKGGLTHDWNKPVQVTSFAGGVKQQIEVQHPQDDWKPYYARLADHLLGGEPLMVTPESARRVIAVLELAEKSNRSGKAEPVPFQ